MSAVAFKRKLRRFIFFSEDFLNGKRVIIK
jgi:hypothetical protein